MWDACWGWPWVTRSALRWKDGQHPKLQFCTQLASDNYPRATTSSKCLALIHLCTRARALCTRSRRACARAIGEGEGVMLRLYERAVTVLAVRTSHHIVRAPKPGCRFVNLALPPGHLTDRSSMALAVAASIAEMRDLVSSDKYIMILSTKRDSDKPLHYRPCTTAQLPPAPSHISPTHIRVHCTCILGSGTRSAAKC